MSLSVLAVDLEVGFLAAGLPYNQYLMIRR